MTPAEQIHKLELIERLPAGELKGWWLYVVTLKFRPAFEGEKGALLKRARALSITLEG